VTKSQLRDHDVFARMGGEEFTIILPECSLEKSIEIAQRIKDRIAKNFININEKSISCTVSLGISTNNN
jgi:diguanylate cyclase